MLESHQKARRKSRANKENIVTSVGQIYGENQIALIEESDTITTLDVS
jgi:hypothetical protein